MAKSIKKLIAGGIAVLVICGILFSTDVFGATILQTQTTDTFNTFRTNVNTSLTNLDDAVIELADSPTWTGAHIFNNITRSTTTAATTTSLYVSGLASTTQLRVNLATTSNLSVTGVALFAPGSASAPSISFEVDPDTGVYRSAANSLAFAVAGSQALALSSALGIGTQMDYTSFVTRGLKLESASPTVGAPNYSFNGDDNTGMWQAATNQLDFTVDGTNTLILTSASSTLISNLTISGNSTTTNATTTNFSATTLSATTARVTTLCLTGDTCETAWPESGGSKIDATTTEVTHANSTTETNLFSATVTGGTLSTNNAIRIRAYISNFSQDAAFGDLAVNLKYGGTTVASFGLDDSSLGSDISGLKGWIEGYVVADGATNAQKGVLTGHLSTNTAEVNTGTVIITKTYGLGNGTGAVDSTANQTLILSVDWAAANVANSITAEFWIVEEIN